MSFKGKKYQCKNWAMQRQGQVLPPCCCIVETDAGGYGGGDLLLDQKGVWGENVIKKNGRGAHLPCQNLFSCFWVLFLEAQEAPLKKKKKK